MQFIRKKFERMPDLVKRKKEISVSDIGNLQLHLL
jgi:hypothetical protein